MNHNDVDNEQSITGSNQGVDGYSDNTEQQNGENLPDAPDRGTNAAVQPMSPEERAKAEEEIRKDERENHPGDLGR